MTNLVDKDRTTTTPPGKSGPPTTRGAGRTRQTLSAGVPVVSFLVLLGVWWLITALEWVDRLFLPSPDAVLSRLTELSAGGELWEDLGVSVYRVGVGFLLATVLALPLGILMGRFKLWAACFEPVIDFIRYMPVVAFVPLTILWVGTDDGQKFLIIFIGTFFQQVLLFTDNVRRVPTELIDVGRTLGLTRQQILQRIVLRAGAPALWDSLRVSLGWAWTWLVVAELVAATSGLGYRITLAQRYLSTETIIGYLLVLGLLGLVTDQLLRRAGLLLFRPAELNK
ncbi:ABC transporter permease [Streptomyces sp. NBC_01166]|uniref:ABC transporter permease n=1 Tax=Streptomyces sp. NBC_01166 TaxID=2903755 RepID=UPI003870277C|nr:ABC transporter permease [Streptomyces sp. NBC_01166]